MNQLKIWQKSFKGNLCILANTFAASKVKLRVISYTRSRRKQAQLVEFPQGYPVAAPGRSQHQYSLAVDLSVSPKSAIAQVGQTWLSMGGWWSPGDPPHFAFFNPQQWAALLSACGPKKRGSVINFPIGSPVELPPLPMPTFPGVPAPPGTSLPFPAPGPQVLPAWNVGSGPSQVAGSVFNPIVASVAPSAPIATTMVGRGSTVVPVSSTAVIPTTTGR